MNYYVYILFSEKYDKFYIGQTNSIVERLKRHNNGYENFTKKYLPWTLKCVIEKESRIEAMTLEKKLKNLNRERILSFIQKYGGNS